MMIAIKAAKQAAMEGEVPVGAVITDTKTGAVITQSHNQMRQNKNPCAHAEITAIQTACALLGQQRLNGYTLTVTLEPCAMCAGAIAHARLDRLIFGAYDAKGGAVEHGACVFTHPSCHHHIEVIAGVEEQQCASLLSDFFKTKRQS